MIRSFLRSFSVLLRYQLRSDFAQPERLVSLFLFAATLQILFVVALAETADQFPAPVAAAQVFLTAFFTLQLAFLKVFEPEETDRAFDQLAYMVTPVSAWFCARVTGITILGTAIVLLVQGMVAIFYDQPSALALSWQNMAFLLLVVHAMSGLGTLLSAMTLRLNARQLLFPIIYFPLTLPVMLCGIQTTLLLSSGAATWSSLWTSWIGLLMVFDFVYFSFGIIFYGELIKSS
jgi:heme exporter protein B